MHMYVLKIIPYNRICMYVDKKIEHASCNRIALYIYIYTFILWNCHCCNKNIRSWFAFHFNAQNSHKTRIGTAPFWYSNIFQATSPQGHTVDGSEIWRSPPLGGIKTTLGGITYQPQLVQAIDSIKAPVFPCQKLQSNPSWLQSIWIQLSYPGDTQSGECIFGVQSQSTSSLKIIIHHIPITCIIWWYWQTG